MSNNATTMSALKLIYLQILCKVPHHAEALEKMSFLLLLVAFTSSLCVCLASPAQ